MKRRLIGYAVIILPIVYVAIHWQVWDGGIGGLILALIATFNCTWWADRCREREEKGEIK